ncbi:hypothetical protein OG259_08870 [Streptomyces sp. NBC_00250]|uniref:hypothetical protein n=1 Tax=Streptomyces sp. NBC_00250 TaxID=2903641 RepID=UPI002E2BE99F|nr:hypothetical protein [Streptomyces sp. NBC_00250]
MSEEPGRRTRLLVGGCVWAVVGAVLLVVIGLLAANAMVGGLARPQPEETPGPTRAERDRQRLESAARDGELSVLDVRRAVGSRPYRQEADETAIRIAVTYEDSAGAPGGCYLFVVPLPLHTDTRVALGAQGEGCEETGAK